MLKILSLKDEANYLIHPKHIVEMAIKTIMSWDSRPEIKAKCKDLLEH